MIRKIKETGQIALYCDFHGHSRKKDIFIYGCNTSAEENQFKERIFPLYIQPNTKNPKQEKSGVQLPELLLRSAKTEGVNCESGGPP